MISVTVQIGDTFGIFSFKTGPSVDPNGGSIGSPPHKFWLVCPSNLQLNTETWHKIS